MGEGGEPRRDLVVTVDEAAPTSIGYGAGVEAGRYLRQDAPGGQASERIELAGRGFFEVGRQNLWGSNRSVNLFTRVSLRPSGVPQASGGSDFGFNEYRVLMSFRDPSVFDVADTRVTGYFEQAVRSSFNFVRRGILAEGARRFKDWITVVGSYSLSQVRLFDERIAPEDRPDIDRLFPQVRISKFQGALRRDTRDDLLDPTRGLVIGVDGDVAARSIWSQVGFVKGYGEVFTYRTIRPAGASSSPAARASAWRAASSARRRASARAAASSSGRTASRLSTSSPTSRRASASSPAATPRCAASRATASATSAPSTRTASRPAATPSPSSTRSCARRFGASSAAWSSSMPATSSAVRPIPSRRAPRLGRLRLPLQVAGRPGTRRLRVPSRQPPRPPQRGRAGYAVHFSIGQAF